MTSISGPQGVSSIVWEEPPERSTRTDRFDDLVESLQGRPNEWARVPEHLYTTSHTTAAMIKAGTVLAFAPKGTFDAVSRKGVLYARYVGPANVTAVPRNRTA